MKICSVCNKENNSNGGNFCVFCGGKLIEKTENIESENKNKIINNNTSQEEKNIIYKDTNKNLKIILIVLVIILIVISGIAIYLKINDNTAELKDEILGLKKQISTLKEEKNRLSSDNASLKQTNLKNSNKIDFFDKNVVFVLDGYGRYYYTYDQMEQVTQEKSFTYWAYNIDQAIDLGYREWKQ